MTACAHLLHKVWNFSVIPAFLAQKDSLSNLRNMFWSMFFNWRTLDNTQVKPCIVYCERSCHFTVPYQCVLSTMFICVPTSWACCLWWHVSSLTLSLTHSLTLIHLSIHSVSLILPFVLSELGWINLVNTGSVSIEVSVKTIPQKKLCFFQTLEG